MSIANTYLYYPLIRIPDETLIYSLLYKDSIKRIIPPDHGVGAQDWEEFDMPNRIIRQALGYEFIQQADFFQSKSEISAPLLNLIKDAYSAKNPEKFERLFGEGYQERFKVKKRIKLAGTFYFLYPEKLDEDVFAELKRIGWLKKDKHSHRCEVEEELWHVYMTLLAANVSRLQGESISTNFPLCEDILRNKIFQQYFKDLLPEQFSGHRELEEICINLALNNHLGKEATPQRIIPLHHLISLQQASYIRAGLDNKRIAFCKMIDNLIKKVVSLEPKDLIGYLEAEIKDIQEAAIEFNAQLEKQVTSELTKDQKERREYWYAGLSLSFPILGLLLDVSTGGVSGIPVGSAAGQLLALLSFSLIQSQPTPESASIGRGEMLPRQQAYIFMNRLWEIRRAKMEELQLA
jgi:hypothetical protein